MSIQKRLLVVSDTGMYQKNGSTYAFGPVVIELEHLLEIFDEIVWIGFERPNNTENDVYRKVSSSKISVIMLPSVGGKGLINKLQILKHYPTMYSVIKSQIVKHDYIHVRAPSNPGLIAMYLSRIYSEKLFWFKYAGTWTGNASFTYRLQRLILKKWCKSSKVTINSVVQDQENHTFSFENPCLTASDRKKGYEICTKTELNKYPNYCFVGNLDANKGVDLLMEAISDFDIGTIHIVGNGSMMGKLKSMATSVKSPIIFHGYLSKEDVIKIYSECDFIVLPSKSEGFPKVIGEAMNYSCVPIVTNISCIDQYVQNNVNGFLIANRTKEGLANKISESLELTDDKFKAIVAKNYELAEKFTYQNYLLKINELILT